MKNTRKNALVILTVGILLITGATLIGCAARDTSAPTVVPETGEDALTDDTVQVVDAPIAVAMDMNAPFTDQECLDCHTDQVQLIELAEPLEVVEGHSEGPG